MRGNIVVGVDLGSSKVAVVAARPVRNGHVTSLEIIGFGEVPVVQGAVVNGSVENVVQVGSAIRAALDQVSSVSNLEIGVVHVSFGGMHVKVNMQNDGVIRPTSSAGEEVTYDDVKQLVDDIYRAKKDANHEVMHVFPKYFTVDASTGIREPVGRPGIKLSADFLVLLANNQSIKRTKRSLGTADASLRVDKLVYAPVATGMAVLTEEERNAGIALVDIGDHTTDLVIYQDNIITHIVSFPVAGRHLTADLKAGCGIQLDNAERLKKDFGTALAEKVPSNVEIYINYLPGRPPRQVLKKNVALIIEERLKEIAAMVYAEILRLNLADELIGGVVLAGGTSNIPDIETVFKRVMDGMPVRVGLPEGLERTPKADVVSTPTYATAVGLAWAGIKPLDERLVARTYQKAGNFRGDAPGDIDESQSDHPDGGQGKPSGGSFGGNWWPGWKNPFGGKGTSSGNEAGEY